MDWWDVILKWRLSLAQVIVLELLNGSVVFGPLVLMTNKGGGGYVFFPSLLRSSVSATQYVTVSRHLG